MDPLQLKGKAAEEYLYQLAQKTFLTDWCYLNPQSEPGKELCDLLVLFDGVALIWQVKNVRLKKGKFPEPDVRKNLGQLGGAKRTLLSRGGPLKLNNPRRGEEVIESSQIERVHLISALMGDEADFWSGAARDPKDAQLIHTFTREFTEIVLGELDTISDFTKYLLAKEELFSSKAKLVLMGDEREFLAYYLTENRSFSSMEGFTDVVLGSSLWEGYVGRPETRAKKKEDEVSYLWDRFIDTAHQSGSETYEIVARELARPDRFQRRVLCKSFKTAFNDPAVNRRFLTLEEVSYVFLFEDMNQSDRQQLLKAVCLVARDKFRENPRVIGIATEKTPNTEPTVDFCFLDFPDWSETNERAAAEIREKFGILQTPRETPFSEDEYPAQT